MSKKAAIVTGAASGIGKALTEALIKRGYFIFAADIDEQALGALASDQVSTHVLDVTNFSDVQNFAADCAKKTQHIDLVFNNAGVMSIGPIADQSLTDIRKVIEINYFGILHGVKAFLPVLDAQSKPSRIINTASLSGLISAPFLGAYNASKYAVIALSETLHFELQMKQSQISVSVMTPGGVKTDILKTRDFFEPSDQMRAIQNQMHKAAQNSSLPAAEFAQSVLAQIDAGKFWILTHPEYNAAIKNRTDDLLAQNTPKFTAW